MADNKIIVSQYKCVFMYLSTTVTIIKYFIIGEVMIVDTSCQSTLCDLELKHSTLHNKSTEN